VLLYRSLGGGWDPDTAVPGTEEAGDSSAVAERAQAADAEDQQGS
jgi:hypothetical protein